MHQTRKGNQWHFGLKALIGADRSSGLVHILVGTTANANDVTIGNALLHGPETDVFADAGYQGAATRRDAIGVTWQVAMRPGVRRHRKTQPRIGKLLDCVERLKAAARAKVEHPFPSSRSASG